MKVYLLPAEGQFYKANLHCHSTCSDGRLTPAEIKAQYMAHGYSVVAYTDHDIMLAHDELADADFLPLHGYEMEINAPGNHPARIKTCHMCLIALEPDNLKQVCWHRADYLFGNAPKYREQVQFYEDRPDYVRHYTHQCISDMMRQGREAGFFVTYNHPVWSMENRDDYIGYDGMHAMEICNYGCIAEGYPDYNPAVYDDLLRAGKRIFCIATDDNHNHKAPDSPCYDSFGGFTMIKASSLDYRVVTRALENGHFYASQGPEIKELWYENGELHLVCTAARRIDFNFGIRCAVTVVAKDGEAVTYAHCRVPEDSGYVRATVTDAQGYHANTNAYFVDELRRAAAE